MLLKSRALARSLDAYIGNYVLRAGADVYFQGYWTFSTHHFHESYKLPHIFSSWYSPHKLSIFLFGLLPHVCTDTHLKMTSLKKKKKKTSLQLGHNTIHITGCPKCSRSVSMTGHDNTFPSAIPSIPPINNQHYPLIPIKVREI